jgi:HrpA-like RNA helicase
MIFATPPSGMRKVVLATNIAETALTVPDVVYVIDPGLCKEMRYDRVHHVTSFGLHWISKANAIQRQGRAGRIQPGECFKLFDKDIESHSMDAFPTAEMLRIPLENVVMQSKLYCPQERAEDFLSTALEPPSKSALNAALRALKIYGILDDDENLTILGKKVVHFTLHPSLSVALVSSAFMGVLDPVLNVVSTLSAPREPFMISMGEERSEIRVVKNRFSNGRKSDHIAYANTVKNYEEKQKNGSLPLLRSFENQNRISHVTMKNIADLKNASLDHLMDSKIIQDKKANEENCRACSDLLVQAALLTGFYPNTVVVREGKMVNGKIKRGYTSVDVETGQNIRLVSESLLKDMSDSLLSTGFITYFSSFYSEEIRQLTLRDGSLVSPLMFILFVGHELTVIPEECDDDRAVYQMDGRNLLKFSVDKNDVNLLLRWKEVMYKLAFWFIRKDDPIVKQMMSSDLKEDVIKCHRVYFSLTNRLLEAEEKLGF